MSTTALNPVVYSLAPSSTLTNALYQFHLKSKTNTHYNSKSSLNLKPHKFPHINYATIKYSPLKVTASSFVENAEYKEEPATRVNFPNSVNLPGCSSSLSLLGTGYREKVFAIIGVKVYAAGLYVNPSVLKELKSWKGKSQSEVEKDLALFQSIYQSSLEKSLLIALVRDVDGKTFWDALDEAVSPRVTAPTPVDESALSTFRRIFQGRSLSKGTLILLTWLDPSQMLVSVSPNGIPTNIDATIDSLNVTKALFDVFFGESPVSPTLKASIANGLATTL